MYIHQGIIVPVLTAVMLLVWAVIKLSRSRREDDVVVVRDEEASIDIINFNDQPMHIVMELEGHEYILPPQEAGTLFFNAVNHRITLHPGVDKDGALFVRIFDDMNDGYEFIHNGVSVFAQFKN